MTQSPSNGAMTLREYRLERGLSQGRIAKLLGVSVQYLSKMELGLKPVPYHCRAILHWHYGWVVDERQNVAKPASNRRRRMVSCPMPDTERPRLGVLAAMCAYSGEVPKDWRDFRRNRDLWLAAAREYIAQGRRMAA